MVLQCRSCSSWCRAVQLQLASLNGLLNEGEAQQVLQGGFDAFQFQRELRIDRAGFQDPVAGFIAANAAAAAAF